MLNYHIITEQKKICINAKKKIVTVNNSTIINKTNNHLSHQIIDGANDR
jgi:hypothetical protein